MSTHAYIAIEETPDRYFRGVALHADGHPYEAGLKLFQHWSNPAKLGELISNGNVSLLGEHIGEAYDHLALQEKGWKFLPQYDGRNWCSFYRRDWSDRLNNPGDAPVVRHSKNAIAETAWQNSCDYLYIFNFKGIWEWAPVVSGRGYLTVQTLTPLTVSSIMVEINYKDSRGQYTDGAAERLREKVRLFSRVHNLR
jgi:hypothetical protein